MKKVITYGTFDLFHVGHLNIIKRAKALGDYLIVAVSSDAFNAQKGKKAYHSDHDRKLILEAIRYVDEVIFEESWDQKIKDVQEHLQLGRNRVYQLIKIDSFPKIKIGNTYRIPKREYLEWVQNNIGKTVFL